MNEMRKLMESLEESLNEEVYEAGGVTVIVTDGQVIVTHGTHRERLVLTMGEWQDFVNMIRGQGL